MLRRYTWWWMGLGALLLWASPAGRAQAPGRLDVTAFGAVPNSRTNAVAAVQRALEACRGLDRARSSSSRRAATTSGRSTRVEKDYFESNTTDNNPKRLAIFIEALQPA